MADMAELCADLADEHADLHALVAPLEEEGWRTPTPAAGWDVRDAISHLTYFEEAAVQAATDPAAFRAGRDALADHLAAGIDDSVERGRILDGAEVLAAWRAARERALGVFRSLDAKTRIPWYGPDMSAASFVTARLMETWAHGQDVADGLGTVRAPTDRLRHIAFLGFRAFPNSYLTRGLAVPPDPVYVVLDAPSGGQWEYGPLDAVNVVRGSAQDFCLVVTQRRHIDDTDVETTGPIAAEWMSIAQAFAGPAGEGRQPGEFRFPSGA